MKQVPRRHTVARTVPWCTCRHDRQTGYLQHPAHGNEYLVHSTCLKPTQCYWEAKEGA